MFQHPWVLCLSIFVVIMWIVRSNRYYLRQATAAHVAYAIKLCKGGIVVKRSLPSFILSIAMMLIIIAAADWVVGKKIVYAKRLVHRYVLIDDASSSMAAGSGKLLLVNPKTLLIEQLSEQLESLVMGNKTFLSTLENISRNEEMSRDYVGLVVFSDDAFVVSYPTPDYATLRVKLDMIQWHVPPLHQGTEISRGLWAGVRMINRHLEQADMQSYSQKELSDIEILLLGSESKLELPSTIMNTTKLLKDSYRGTSLIIFTDGQFSLDGSTISFSGNKILSLCQLLGIRVYAIVGGSLDPHYTLAFKQTGGNAFIVSHISKKSLSSIYTTIAQSQAQEQIIEEGTEIESRYLYCAIPGIILLFAWLLVKNTISRSLTSV